MGYIYKITNAMTGGIYIGQTTKTLQERFHTHKRESRRILYYGVTPFYRDIKKYGINNFFIEELEYVEDNKKLNDLEIYYIKKFDSYRKTNKNNYNLTTGGSNIHIMKPKVMPYTLMKIDCKTNKVLKTYYSFEEIYKDYPRYKYQAIIKVSLGYTKTAYGYFWKRSKDIGIVYDPEKNKKYRRKAKNKLISGN